MQPILLQYKLYMMPDEVVNKLLSLLKEYSTIVLPTTEGRVLVLSIDASTHDMQAIFELGSLITAMKRDYIDEYHNGPTMYIEE